MQCIAHYHRIDLQRRSRRAIAAMTNKADYIGQTYSSLIKALLYSLWPILRDVNRIGLSIYDTVEYFN